MNFLRDGLILCLRGYRAFVSPVLTACFGPLGMGCRFTPTCSQYSMEAIQTHGVISGVWLTLRRLARCHPWGGHGLDQVPPVQVNSSRSNMLTPCSGPSHPSCDHGS